MPFTLFPKPTLLASVVIAGSLAGGMAMGAAVAGTLLLVHRIRRG